MKKNKSAAAFGILGLGRFGSALAKTLAGAGAEVIVVDKDENNVKELRKYTENAFVAGKLTREVLEEIGIQNCDTVIVCIGEKIDTSILTTLNVVSMGVPNVIAKAISLDQGAVLEKIGAKVVYPESDMAVRLANRLMTRSVLDYISLKNNVEIAEVKVSGELSGQSIVKSGIRKKYGLNIIAIERTNRTDIEIAPDYCFGEGDIVVVIGKAENIKRFEEDMA